jgi:hypothetical protein
VGLGKISTRCRLTEIGGREDKEVEINRKGDERRGGLHSTYRRRRGSQWSRNLGDSATPRTHTLGLNRNHQRRDEGGE